MLHTERFAKQGRATKAFLRIHLLWACLEDLSIGLPYASLCFPKHSGGQRQWGRCSWN